MFGREPAPWDQERKYTPSTVEVGVSSPTPTPTPNITLPPQVYYEDHSSHRLIQVSLETTLNEVISSKG